MLRSLVNLYALIIIKTLFILLHIDYCQDFVHCLHVDYCPEFIHCLFYIVLEALFSSLVCKVLNLLAFFYKQHCLLF